MSHRADQIMDAIVQLLQASTTLGIVAQNIYPHRTLSLADDQGEMPAATVNFGEDTPVSEFGTDNMAFIDSVLGISIVTFHVDTEEHACRRTLLNHRRRVHSALLTDQSLGLPFVIGTRYGGAAAPEFDSTTKVIAGSLESRWLVHYRMNVTDPGD